VTVQIAAVNGYIKRKLHHWKTIDFEKNKTGLLMNNWQKNRGEYVSYLKVSILFAK